MLLANMAVSHKISNSFPEAALLRRHQPPILRTLQETAEKLASVGVILDLTDSKSLHESFVSIQDPVQQLIARLLCIKSMKRAEYFCTGTVDVSTFSHYALSVPLYTHFTSPIRRYCDLVVHRLLELALNVQDNIYDTAQVKSMAHRCNDRKQAAREAQDASQNVFLCVLLAKLQKDSPEEMIVEAYVNDVGTRAFDVLVPRYGIESRVWVEDSVASGEVTGVEVQEGMQLKVHWVKGEQTIKMFDVLKVRVAIDMSRSPTTYKLFAVCPFQ